MLISGPALLNICAQFKACLDTQTTQLRRSTDAKQKHSKDEKKLKNEKKKKYK